MCANSSPVVEANETGALRPLNIPNTTAECTRDASSNGMNEMIRDRRYDDAIVAFRRVATMIPNAIQAVTMLCDVYCAIGDNDIAINEWREATNKSPTASWLWNGLYNAYNAAREYAKKPNIAIKAWKDAVEKNPSAFWVWNGLCNGCLKVNYDAALATSKVAWWSPPYETEIQGDKKSAKLKHNTTHYDENTLTIYTDGSGIEGHVGAAAYSPKTSQTRQQYLGSDEEHNIYSAEVTAFELAAGIALDSPLSYAKCVIYADSQSAIQGINNPNKQSGQRILISAIQKLETLIST